MRQKILRLFILTVCLSSSNAYAQIDRLVEGVRSRVSDAAEAATVVLEADRHRLEAERMFAAGQYDAARRELQVAAEIVGPTDQLRVQGDLLLHDYASKLNQSFAAIEDAREPAAFPGYAATRAGLSFIESVLTANSLPTALAAIVTVESAGDRSALSSKGARGLWQLMPDTARRYGLRVDNHVDERIYPVKSTQAAARYLRDLYDMFNDWPLVLAAYNGGENRILKLIEKTRIHRFTEMADRGLLPAETILYVPAVLSLMYPEISRD